MDEGDASLCYVDRSIDLNNNPTFRLHRDI